MFKKNSQNNKSYLSITWLSGFDGCIKTVYIDAKGFIRLAGILIICSFLLFFIFLKITVHYKFEPILIMVGLKTDDQLNRMQSIYLDYISQIRESRSISLANLNEVVKIKARFMDLATPNMLDNTFNHIEDHKRIQNIISLSSSNHTLESGEDQFEYTLNEFTQINKSLIDLQVIWKKQIDKLLSIPTVLPIRGNYSITNDFFVHKGIINGKKQKHEGITFLMIKNNQVLSTANGTVTRSYWDSGYGNVIEILHGEGFVTRYACLSTRIVKKGEIVKQMTVLGESGSTCKEFINKSKKSYLHYEVFYLDQMINPELVLLEKYQDM